ncbi:MAG: hypothetical protein CVT64_10620 [Actinobacteria bacterium HGW-Actinobacteria-4]|nr:MAG: hypothetical protein CVT64_10620 [Actinobacteria bacterium HGW-Actinobacteria-4]
MDSEQVWRRRWSVTALRGLVALTFTMVWALGGIAVVQIVGSGGTGPDWQDYRGVVLVFLAVPVMWLVPLGGVLDHYLSRWGATVVALVHVAGGVWTFLVVLMVAVVAFSRGPAEEAPSAFAIVLAGTYAPWMVAGFLVAWLVPGSFPRGGGLVLSRFRRLRGWLRG